MKIPMLVAAVIAAACTGCSEAHKASEQPEGNGPVTLGTARGELCMPMPAASSDVTLGQDVVRNTGTEPATITAVSAVDPKALRITEVVIVPIDDSLFGAWTTWPPRSTNQPAKAAQWKTRRSAIGYRVPPQGATHQNLVAHIVKDPGATESTMRALRVEYTVGNRSFWTETTTRLVLKPRCS